MNKAAVPARLVDCKGTDQQASWIARSLRAGSTLSDFELWIAGVDRPEAVITCLRGEGCRITTTKKRVVDAADEAHDDLAWCLTK